MKLLPLLLLLVGSTRAFRDPNLFPDHDCNCNIFLNCAPFTNCECRLERTNACSCRSFFPPGLFQTCFNIECCRDTRRRLLGADVAFDGDEPEYREHLEKCGDYEYEALLFVDSHLHGVVSPKEEAMEAGCPFLVVHAVFEGTAPGRKEILFFDDKQSGEYLFADGKLAEGSLPLGIFKLHELARAYDEADAGSEASYDIVSNNCGSFMVDLATKLGLTVDTKVTSFVARRLIEDSGKQLAEMIRSNLKNLSPFGDRHLLRGETATDEELVEALVESHASGLYE